LSGTHEHPTEEGGAVLTESEERTDAIQGLLIEKGLLTADQVRRRIEQLDSITPARGGQVVARAWVDPAYKARLLADGNAAVAELGLAFSQSVRLEVVENTPAVHHVVVCTLCSCYPKALLGMPPDWYKSLAYRSRTVAEPRGVLREFGCELSPEVEVRVVDSTADLRYLVLPLRPAGTEGMSEEALAALVTRDALIGVAQVAAPARAR
jgi:nitrile hydratase